MDNADGSAGDNGLPLIDGNVTIYGNCATIRCEGSAAPFRLLSPDGYVINHATATYAEYDNQWSSVFPGGEYVGHLVFEIPRRTTEADFLLVYADTCLIIND